MFTPKGNRKLLDGKLVATIGASAGEALVRLKRRGESNAETVRRLIRLGEAVAGVQRRGYTCISAINPETNQQTELMME